MDKMHPKMTWIKLPREFSDFPLNCWNICVPSQQRHIHVKYCKERRKRPQDKKRNLSNDTNDLVLKRLKDKREKLCNSTSPTVCTRHWHYKMNTFTGQSSL